MSGAVRLRSACLLLALCVLWAAGAGVAATPAGEWLGFQGSWSVTGQRQTIPTDSSSTASIVHVSGSVVLATSGGLARGFSAEAVGFDDGHGTSLGRCVWTDAHGDQLFSKLRGEALQTGKRVVGTIVGGTGRYAGVEGEYTLTWQFVVPGEEGQFQGRTVSLSGRVRRAEVP
jgi:hypothetical protein